MNRRHFLVLMGLSSLALTVSVASGRAAGEVVSLNGRLLRGTAGGEILESTDNGQTWARAAFFGASRPVLGLAVRGDHALAQVGVAAHSFTLNSADGRLWRTRGAGTLRG